MYSRLLLLMVFLTGLPLAAQDVTSQLMTIIQKEGAPAFVCVEEDCERLAWLPAGARVMVTGEAEGPEIEGSALWYEVLLDCPCFDFERSRLKDMPDIRDPERNRFHVWHPYISPDSQRIAAVVQNGLYIWDAASGERTVQAALGFTPHVHIAWSPDGTRIAAAAGIDFDDEGQGRAEPEFSLFLMNADGSSPVPLSGSGRGVLDLAWSPDDRRIALVEHSDDREISALRLRDAASGELLASLEAANGTRFGEVAWTPNGSQIAYTSFQVTERENDNDLVTDSALHLWDGISQELPAPLFSSSDWIIDTDWSPDGRFLVVPVLGGVIVTDTTDGRTVASLAPQSIPYYREWEAERFLMMLVDWSPDGRRIVASGMETGSGLGTIQSAALVWDLTLIPAGPTRAFIHSGQLGGA